MGAEPPSWPKSTPQAIWSRPALVALNGDGHLDIIEWTIHYYLVTGGYRVYAWDHNGGDLPGWPVPTQWNFFSSPAVSEIDGDSLLDVAVHQGLFNHAGACLGIEPERIHYEQGNLCSAVLGDNDAEGSMDVVFGLNSAPAIVDFDRDGKVDIAHNRFDSVTVDRTRKPYHP